MSRNLAIWNKKNIISPSLICFDLCNLETQIKQAEDSGIEMLHVDILDGHFSPSMPIGLETVRQLRAKTDLAFDVHLMADRHEYFVDELLDIGVDQIVFHLEKEPHIDGLINRIQNKGVRAGVALKPATPLTELNYILEKCDTVLLMLINPGYAQNKGESQVCYANRKITDLKEMITAQGLHTLIEIDGRISPDDIRKYGGKEVDIFVAGSTCFSKDSVYKDLKEINGLGDLAY